MNILDKLASIKMHWQELEKQLSDPAVVSDREQFAKLNKEYSDLKKIVDVYDEYTNVLSNITANKEILNTEKDEEFRAMAKDELEGLDERKEELEGEIKILLIPKDPEDEKKAIIEIRAGAGGDEASIFAGDLYRMYTRFLDNKGWNYEYISDTPGTVGGFKEVVFEVNEPGAYGALKYESGVHRVQRVPATESQGRVHTSAASVAVLPEVEDVDVELNEKDIKRDTFRASGAGGQHVNKTDSAIRLTHIPTGIVVECQDERSQHKNLDKAMKVLRARMYEIQLAEQQKERSAQRKSLVSTGDRSAKIRTYNFPQGRVTDHRINLTQHNLADVMQGDIESIIEALRLAENAEKLQESAEL